MHNDSLDNSQLRKFGFILSFGICGIFGILLPYQATHPMPTWPWLVGAAVLAVSLIRAQWLKLIYTPWMKLGAILGWINTRIILGVIFFFIITPIGLIMRLKHDPMQRQYDPKANTYRKIISVAPIKHMEKPF